MSSYPARTKYDEPGRARRYAERSPRRDAEEWRLLAACLVDHEAPADALDVPCGTGRIAERLIERGIPTLCADLSEAMRDETRRRLDGREGFLGVRALDLDAAPPDEAVADLVVCFRFLHHLPDAEARARVLRHLRALTRRHVLLSFHHPVSFHNLQRLLRRVFTGRRSDRHTIGVRRLRREAAAAGLEVVSTRALAAWRRELWVARLRRAPDAREASA
jgi:SAM-dependent methyltransferase